MVLFALLSAPIRLNAPPTAPSARLVFAGVKALDMVAADDPPKA
jgi:hypothetical protein